MKLEISNRRKTEHFTNLKKLSNTLPVDQRTKHKGNEKWKYLEMKQKHNIPKLTGCSKGSAKKEIKSYTY